MDITAWIMIIGWVFVLLWIPFIIYTNKDTHPKALFVLFFAEMWERFSYYGMRALLVLYMTKVLFIDLAQNVAETQAYGIYGSYTAMVYLFPVLGGLVADKLGPDNGFWRQLPFRDKNSANRPCFRQRRCTGDRRDDFCDCAQVSEFRELEKDLDRDSPHC